MEGNPPRHLPDRLKYAIDTTGKLISVDDVPNGKKCGCFCPACKEPLMAKNQGNKRVHHFAHQSGTECAYALESMLHLLAKEKIRDAFFGKNEFWIEFEYRSYCLNHKKCKFLRYDDCYVSQKQRFNIKQFYDSCEQEKPYDNINRRSDLKIFSSTNPERSPIYLEFCVTHASDSAKLHSGNKIIEIYLNSEEDVCRLIEHGIIETTCNSNDEYIEIEYDTPPVVFYGFKKEDHRNPSVSSEIIFIRHILYQSGKMRCFRDTCNCKKLVKSQSPSLFEICVHTADSFNIGEHLRYIAYQRFKIPNCMLCKNYVESYNGMGKICRLYKYLQIPRDENFDTARAKTCRYFEIDQKNMESEIQKGLNASYTIV